MCSEREEQCLGSVGAGDCERDQAFLTDPVCPMDDGFGCALRSHGKMFTRELGQGQSGGLLMSSKTEALSVSLRATLGLQDAGSCGREHSETQPHLAGGGPCPPSAAL